MTGEPDPPAFARRRALARKRSYENPGIFQNFFGGFSRHFDEFAPRLCARRRAGAQTGGGSRRALSALRTGLAPACNKLQHGATIKFSLAGYRSASVEDTTSFSGID